MKKIPFPNMYQRMGNLVKSTLAAGMSKHTKQWSKILTKIFCCLSSLQMDKTTISSTAHMSVYAVMFTTTLFDYKIRNKAQAWRPLGYIPIEKNFILLLR